MAPQQQADQNVTPAVEPQKAADLTGAILAEGFREAVLAASRGLAKMMEPPAPAGHSNLEALSFVDNVTALRNAFSARNSVEIKVALDKFPPNQIPDLMSAFADREQPLPQLIVNLDSNARVQVLKDFLPKLTPEQTVPFLQAVISLNNNQETTLLVQTVTDVIGEKLPQFVLAYKKSTGQDLIKNLADKINPVTEQGAFVNLVRTLKGDDYKDAARIGALLTHASLDQPKLRELISAVENAGDRGVLAERYQEIFPGKDLESQLQEVYNSLAGRQLDEPVRVNAGRVLVGGDLERAAAAIPGALVRNEASAVIGLLGDDKQQVCALVERLDKPNRAFSQGLMELPFLERNKLLDHVLPHLTRDQVVGLFRIAVEKGYPPEISKLGLAMAEHVTNIDSQPAREAEQAVVEANGEPDTSETSARSVQSPEVIVEVSASERAAAAAERERVEPKHSPIDVVPEDKIDSRVRNAFRKLSAAADRLNEPDRMAKSGIQAHEFIHNGLTTDEQRQKAWRAAIRPVKGEGATDKVRADHIRGILVMANADELELKFRDIDYATSELSEERYQEVLEALGSWQPSWARSSGPVV